MKKALFLTMLLTSLWANAKDVLITSYGNANHEVVSQIITYELDDATSEASVKRIEVFSTHVVIPSNIEDNGRSYRVVSIGDGEDQSSLVRIDDNISTFSIELPTTCSSIGNYAFYKVSQLVSITGLEGIYEIGNYAFCETGLTSLVLPQRISEYIMVLDGDIVIGDYAFYRCPITTLSLGSTKSIGDYGFSGITLSETLYIPVTMCIIGDHAFEDCPNIQIVQFGTQRIGIDSQKVRRIGDFAFSRCESLEILYMLSGYTYCWGQSICASCPNLENYSDAHIGEFQDYSNNVHHSADVTHHNTFDHGLLIHGIGTNDTIVSSLPKYNGIPSAIESGMHYKNVKYISSMALSYYPTKTLSINAAHLGTYVLFNSEIEEVTFGKDVEAIDGEPFLQCGKLKKVTCLATTPPVIPVSPWNHDDVTLFVPAGCTSAYQNATYWNQFGTIKEILISDIKMENSEEHLYVGATKQLNLTVEGGIASPETIEWSTTDKSIATVNIEGLITAIKEGVATITATAKDGSGVSASCTVTVVSGDDDIYESLNIVDGTDYQNTITKQYESLTFTKTFSATSVMKWNAFYVPININVEEYAGELDFAQIYAFCATVDTNGDGTVDADDENFLFVRPVKTGCIEANVPYLIRPHEAKTYIINSADNILYKTATGQVEFSTSLDKFTVTGLNEAFTVTAGDNNYYVTAAGQLSYRASGSTTVKANRWIMHRESKAYGNNNGTARAKEYRIVALGEEMDETTAIDMVTLSGKHNSLNGGVYMLDGRKLNAANKLSGGIYIKNGKKFIVK